jgi:TolB protein
MKHLLVLVLAILAVLSGPRTSAADPGTSSGDAQPDESALGTVEVNGSAGGLPPLPKMSVVPIVPTGAADSVVNLVVRHDMELSGQFEVLGDDKAPPGPFTHTSVLDLAAFHAAGAEYVVRVFSQPAPTNSARTELVGEAFVPPSGKPAAGAPDPKPAFRGVVPTETTEVRAASHRLVDLLLGALTGRPGGFASEMAYAEKVGRWRRIYAIDSDGFNLRSVGPGDQTAISPAFGPGSQIFYALSTNYSAFHLVFGPNASPVPVDIPGSVMGLGFNPEHTRMALVTMDEGKSDIWIADKGNFQKQNAPPFANHPVFGPLGKVAFVAGTPVQRIYIDNKPVSPPGFMASAPVFCDTPQGLLVIYTVGVGAGADIIATDTSGGSLRRLTQHEGANTYAACSPD